VGETEDVYSRELLSELAEGLYFSKCAITCDSQSKHRGKKLCRLSDCDEIKDKCR
jgi:hypothetical protein